MKRRIRSSAFTLTEIVIVIGLIVLLIALAVPAFNIMTGGKNVDTAMNTLSAALGRARAEAIGLQKYTGVWFFKDPKTLRRGMAIVQEVDAPTTGGAGIDVWLDVVDNADIIPLPSGISVQLVDDRGDVAGAKEDDRYIGFNRTMHTTSGTNVVTIDAGGSGADLFGGVVLFNKSGQLVSKTYGFRLSSGTGSSAVYTGMGRLLQLTPAQTISGAPLYVIPELLVTVPSDVVVLKTQFGLIMFEDELFKSAGTGFGDDDPQVVSGTYKTYAASTEPAEEDWLDKNATPVMINRYTGALVKGE